MKLFWEQMADFDARRERARITDAELAAEAHTAPATISRYRTGVMEPSVSRWANLNNALDRLIARRIESLQQAQ